MHAGVKVFEEAAFDSGTTDFTFSIQKKRYIVAEDGTTHYVGEPIRMAVVPGDIERVKEFAPQLAHAFESIWTPEVVKAYKQLRAEDEARMQEQEATPDAHGASPAAMFMGLAGAPEKRRKSVAEAVFGVS